MSAPIVCVPGQRVGQVDDKNVGGPGTYVRDGYIYASLAGFLSKGKNNDGNIQLEVHTSAKQNVVPQVGSTVTVKIKVVNPRFCKCDILTVEQTVLREPFRGMIRREDVRATEKDKIEIPKCFRSGDIALARVISLGDAQSYLLTTAENELGVVVATSEAGVPLVPISWQEMQCPVTFTKEHRKVAKVQPQHIEKLRKP